LISRRLTVLSFVNTVCLLYPGIRVVFMLTFPFIRARVRQREVSLLPQKVKSPLNIYSPICRAIIYGRPQKDFSFFNAVISMNYRLFSHPVSETARVWRCLGNSSLGVRLSRFVCALLACLFALGACVACVCLGVLVCFQNWHRSEFQLG
jgi:TRAP-type mannitol/chloroaromatic compound transport system permease small subunit